MLTIDRPSGIPLDQHRLAEAAALYGAPLPADYLAFLRAANGGSVGLDDDERAQVFDMRVLAGLPVGREVVSLIYFIGDQAADPVVGSVASATLALRESGLAAGKLVFGECQSTIYLCMASAEGGAIRAYPQDYGFTGSGILLAPSFGAFCRMVYRHPYRDL